MIFEYHVYNSQGACLAGVDLPVGKTVEEVVAAFIAKRPGALAYPALWDEDTGCYWFGEKLGPKTYNRYVVPACGRDWP